MRCIVCNRPLLRPTATIGGQHGPMNMGPVCARRAGLLPTSAHAASIPTSSARRDRSGAQLDLLLADDGHDQPATPAPMQLNPELITQAGETLRFYCHGQARENGWWTELLSGRDLTSTGYPLIAPTKNVPELLMLVVSEIAEAMEGHRKVLMDDKLPKRTMLEVELADAVIRIFDLSGGLGLDVPGAIAEKLAYNATRADHKPEARRAEGGKKF